MAICRQCQSENATKKCSVCKQVWYCNKDCQKAHYKIHKKECAQLAQSGRKPEGSSGTGAGTGETIQLQDDDFEALKKNFDHVCGKYNLRSEEKAGQIADFLTDPNATNFDTQAVADNFGMSMRDANTFLMWIQVGTKFKREVIDKNAELASQGKV